MALSPIQTALLVLRIAGPAILILLAASLSFLRPSHDHDNLPIVSVIVSHKVPRRALILSFLFLTAIVYFLDGVLVVARAVLSGVWEGSSQHWRFIEIADVLGLVAFAGLAALGTWKDVNGVEVWTRSRVKVFAILATVVDIAQIVLIALSVNIFKNPPVHTPEGPSIHPLNVPNALHFLAVVLRLLFLLVLVPALYLPRISYVPVSRNATSENANASTRLLVPSAVPAASPQYGTFGSSPQTPFLTRTHTPTLLDGAPSSANPQANPPPAAAPTPLKPNPRDEVSVDPTWPEIYRRLRKLTPYLLPGKDRRLQTLALLCILLLVVGRFVNAALPFTLGKLVRVFERRWSSGPDPSVPSPWPYLVAYVVLHFLQSPGGLSTLRDTLWTPVLQYSDREMSQLSFDHLLNLSLAFHTRRKTGEILRILDRGQAINHIAQLFIFNIGPTFFDIIIALALFCATFGWPLALVILVVMSAYVAASFVLIQRRAKIRRQMNDRDVITRGIHTDCLLNYETVKYFGGEQHEGERYRDAVRQYQTLEYRVMVSLNVMFLVQNLIFSLGILVGSLLVGLQISNKEKDASDYVIFITLLTQLYVPINSIAFIYRAIIQSLVDTERLMALLDEPTEVNDKPGAGNLDVETGEIEFQNVNFSYDDRTTALNDVSFKVPKNSSVALVGESGSGKSTVLRLLYRFYDLQEGDGRILVDGHDIRDVTQQSLRKAIGVVPQDCVLFNASIQYNIGYGKFGSTPEEIEAAAKAAQMHERIMSFPDGYDTKVGERGVRLSGGEKQRVAIARTLLKNPPILLLDEATSALDTSTEKDIQKALQNLVKGRSSLTIAHRLSTIANADLILVLKDGRVVESGSFRELLAQNGLFATMWADQVSGEDELSASVHKEAVSGYNVTESKAGQVEPREETNVASPEPQNPFADPAAVDFADDFIPTDSPQPLDPELAGEARTEPTEEGVKSDVPAPDVPPGQTAPSAQPISFPASSSQPEIAPPGVTFGAEVASPPSRSGTPDLEGKPKRIRKTSQNIQKFARTLSLAARRQSTGSSVAKAESPRSSREDSRTRGEGSVGGDSTEASEDGKGKKRKGKAPKGKGTK